MVFSAFSAVSAVKTSTLRKPCPDLWEPRQAIAARIIIMCMDSHSTELLRLLANRLERLSVDSVWARRASGLRGNVNRVLDEIENNQQVDPQRVHLLVEYCFEILQKAAREIPDLEATKRDNISSG